MLKWAKHQPQGRHFQHISTFSDMNGKNFDRLKTKNRYSTNQLSVTPRKLSTIHPRRHSLTGHANKENFGVYFARSPFGANNSSNAFQDLSNTKSPQRQEANSTPRSTRHRNMPEPSSGRFSDNFADIGDRTPLSAMDYYCRDIQEESLSSSQMGDKTLDRMLDAIIESARKEVKSIKSSTVFQQTQQRLQLTLENENEIKDCTLYGDDTDASIHEMEVRTPTHLKRQRVVRRKNPKVPSDKPSNKAIGKQKPLIGLTLPNGIPSPDTPLFKDEEDVACANVTPQNFMFVVENDYRKCTDEMTRSSTPTIEEAQSIKRCLSFSSASDDDDVDYSAAKRGSVASSNASSTAGDYLSSGRTSRSSQNSLKFAITRGSLEVSASIANDKLNVHVVRCRDLQRPNGSTALNAYVKVALIMKSREEQEKTTENVFQRTAVHRHSSRPYFDHNFHFNLNPERIKPDLYGPEDRIQLAVWHRDRRLKRSEFLGCLSFPLLTLLSHPINGIFKLQSRACLNNPHPPQPAGSQTLGVAHNHNDCRTQQSINDNTHPEISTHPQLPLTLDSQVAHHTHYSSQPVMTTIVLHKSEDEDVISIDSMTQVANITTANGEQQPMVLSKKALHQRDADENLFLRFLELDPPTDATATGTNPPNSGGSRRMSVTGKPIGRTPFTMTKKLIRTAERGFGFSIVWTHPPRVEKVEAGLSADRCGILPGDYVIFVDKHNVVTMPEADVLNLIRSQGTTLTLEIFRRSGSGGSFAAASTTGRSLTTATVANGKAASTLRLASAASDELQSTATTVPIGTAAARRSSGVNAVGTTAATARPSTACSGTSSIEAAKRRLNLPQVTFSKEVGNGVIV